MKTFASVQHAAAIRERFEEGWAGGDELTPRSFAEDRAGLLEQMRRFVEARENGGAHPIFGPMRPEEWMRWGYLHTDHHLRQFGR